MRNSSRTFALVWCLLLCGALPAAGQSTPNGSSGADQGAGHHAAKGPAQAGSTASKGMTIDGIAARIGNNVVTDSEVRQLEDYQRLIDGQAQSRAKVVQELVDQWIVRSEAAMTKFPHPSASEVTREFQTLAKQFPSAEEFRARLAKASLTPNEVRQVLERQIYYVRFLDYKFHAATQVTSAQIEEYYETNLTPQLKKQGRPVPPLKQVDAQIRQLLTQEEVNVKAAQWLEEAKARLRIVVQPSGGGG